MFKKVNVKKYLPHGIVCLVTWFYGSQAVEAQQIGKFFIKNSLSDRCIDVAGAPGTSNGARLQLFDCEQFGENPNGSTTDQAWRFTNEGFIKNVLSGKCIDVAGAPGRNNGARLQLFDCEQSGPNSSTTDQTWQFTTGGLIINKLSRKCIDVAGAPGRNNGARLQLFDCEQSGPNGSTTDQKWSVTPAP